MARASSTRASLKCGWIIARVFTLPSLTSIAIALWYSKNEIRTRLTRPPPPPPPDRLRRARGRPARAGRSRRAPRRRRAAPRRARARLRGGRRRRLRGRRARELDGLRAGAGSRQARAHG